ncbi:STAS-like domain-containing protein [uncultured Draconibacterium sp.]|uniref:STAS-like domain-containing protein n=1 Tax=uncultured Draconibacterium sp. TaxID=1573823 RepID=UPI00374821B5
METIILKDVVGGSFSSSDGYGLYCILKPYFFCDQEVLVSLEGFSVMSSSFFNSSFGELIEEFGIEKFKHIIKFVSLTRSQANLIRRYVEFHLL